MGIFRRRIILSSIAGRVEAGVEDDQHHIRVTLEHNGKFVTGVKGESIRVPFSTCPGAEKKIVDLIGMPLTVGVIHDKALWPSVLNPRVQCTHMFELALLAIAQAARGGRRQYEISVPDPNGQTPFEVRDGKLLPKQSQGTTKAELRRNGEQALLWLLKGELILEPALFTGQSLRAVLLWAYSRSFDDDLLEAIMVLRRGLHVATGRVMPIQQLPTAESMSLVAQGACHVFQPERIGEGRRNMDSLLDFTDRSGMLLIKMQAH